MDWARLAMISSITFPKLATILFWIVVHAPNQNSMASFHGNRFPGPMFNQNFPRSNFIPTPVGNRFSMPPPPFQRPPNPAFRPYQAPERFMSGNFQNRPHFSNFPEPGGQSGFLNRPPPNNQVFPMSPAHSFPRPRTPFERPFRPWNQMPPAKGGPRPQLQNRPRPPIPPHHMRDLPLQPNKKGKLKIREFRKLKSWMTDELFAEVKKKNTLYLKAKSSDEQTAWQEFRLQRNRVSSLIKEAKIKAGLISRKIKEDDNTEKPFSCDTCDRAFATQKELNDHISLHIKCDHANCTFEAHPKIVALHKKMQHDTGYADKISKLKDDAEIQKWREERRKRFPTAENILKRKAEQAEKEARGEVLETKEFGKFKRRKGDDGDSVKKDFRRKRSRNYRKSNDRRRQFHPRSQPFTINLDSDSDSDSDSHIKLNKFLGMSLANSANVITDKTETVEVSSSPYTGITPISDRHKSPPESWCEQNLPKSKFDDNIRHPNLPYSDSSNLDKNQTTIVLNDDNFNDLHTSSNLLSEVPFAESGVIKENCLLEEDFINESVCEVPVDDSPLKKHKKVELIEIKDCDEDPIAVSVENSMDYQDNKQDSDDEGPIAIPIVKSVEDSVNNQNLKQKSEETHSSDVTLVKASKNSNSENRHTNNDKYNRHQRNHHSHTNGQDVQEVRKSSLLEKLLADDIRHERNVILQCIRHIVKNKFFGVEGKRFK